jgi:ribosome biogenesis protein BRX1
MQTFGTPRRHPRSQPFIDHVLTFSVTDDGRIWFRNYQIIDETTQQMEEIGTCMHFIYLYKIDLHIGY